MVIGEFPRGVLPLEGAMEVPEGFARTMMAVGESIRPRAGWIKKRMRFVQESFLAGYLTTVFPGIEECWTTEGRLVEPGLPTEEPVWDHFECWENPLL